MVAKYPPMGWNSWDCYGAAVNEKQVRDNADYMAKYMKEYGWEYVVVDIQWYEPTADSSAYHPPPAPVPLAHERLPCTPLSFLPLISGSFP